MVTCTVEWWVISVLHHCVYFHQATLPMPGSPLPLSPWCHQVLVDNWRTHPLSQHRSQLSLHRSLARSLRNSSLRLTAWRWDIVTNVEKTCCQSQYYHAGVQLCITCSKPIFRAPYSVASRAASVGNIAFVALPKYLYLLVVDLEFLSPVFELVSSIFFVMVNRCTCHQK